jgi:hypothetical protein
MSDQFDSQFDNPQQPAVQARTYDVVPRGVCRVEIAKAERKAVPWRASTSNPQGECIVLRLRPSSAHAFVFVDLPDDKPWLRQHVARAAGIDADACTPEVLVGLSANVEIDHVALRDGRIKAVVRKWLPASGAPQAASTTPTLVDAIKAWSNAPPRQPVKQTARRSRNAQPHYEPDDDIPF